MAPLAPHSAAATKILAAAKAQEGTRYNARYVSIAYPNGDVPKTQGACTDVVIRALRADGIDLQKLVHEDMINHFASYPQEWHMREPDSNIDHRRVPNLMHFFSRHAQVLTTTVSPLTLTQWQPGDIVFWNLGTKTHTGIVSDTRNTYGEPYVVDNGYICVEEDALTRWKVTGHYRYPPSKPLDGRTHKPNGG